ncbi:MAG: hypothetical protein CGU28_03680 [Candidatus Dactylopiibacterium carminicum]|uniref:Uncharacterized protein n=1 Tax=Candidatus Dactylopiibacterium carminicum TaxID=857335 RepID=A0A272EY56_9RHOO|nr:hypothetical protein [Candidatus Dactylopiibacterium carminicum]KAF7600418.1 hypothetical protein BGI27_02425 [Candidatus Dactylopiibacterium carminicum]PAS95039.1 MAG: hypothetical protein CGU29_00905 [Candidatus Dactylopiibacterium carminicum]PAS97852.1 MAG: hypothetical protein CGU28_03680 [Candidatus Dactylopiibacterium carminicum]PAT00417.1 MAG: hypothetical protein BSR46_02435 [Candidatus Dactylopiibacterium carminicum]
MLLKNYEQAGLFFNMNFLEATEDAKAVAYRGELIVIEGEIGDASGRRKPPVKVLTQVNALSDGEGLVFLAGLVDTVADVPDIVVKYGQDIRAATSVLLFVPDITQATVVEANGARLVLLPIDEGLVWTELMDLAALEKGDLKSLSSADKIRAVAAELTSYQPRKSAAAELSGLAALSNGKFRETRGAV